MKRLMIPLCLLLLLLISAGCGGASVSPITTPPEKSTIHQQQGTLPALITRGDFQEYALPQEKSGLMRPVIDHQGRIWMGEMGHNSLAYFDPRTKTFQQMTPPRGDAGIMGVVIAADDTAWFTEQNANYIGQYNSTTRQYKIFNLPTLHIPDPGDKSKTIDLPSAPNDLTFDRDGNLWFTEMNADTVGRLNVHTGEIHHFSLSSQKTLQTLQPYGITADAQGTIWVSTLGTNRLYRLNQSDGSFTSFTFPGSNNPLMELASDQHGYIWGTTLNTATLIKFDPRTKQFSSFLAPDTGAGAGGIYGITITPGNVIWVTVPAANVIARFEEKQARFVYYPIPTRDSSPLGIIESPDQHLWFTEARGNKLASLSI